LPTQTAGGSGSETVIGKAILPGGAPAAKAVVRLRRAGYLSPLNGTSASDSAYYMDAVTDDSGRFSISILDTGNYCLEINSNAGHAALFRLMVDGTSKSADLGAATLAKTASAFGISPDAAGGAAQIFGLERLAAIDSLTGSYSFSDLPAGAYTFRIVPQIKSRPVVTISSVKLDAGDIQNLSLMSGWAFSKRLYFNTSVTGANVSATLSGFPVLVRLTGDKFDFTQAQKGGEDIRFSKPDNSPLSYEIERWDAAKSLAEIWVKVDTIFGNDSIHFITMYWGASGTSATSLSSGAAVFDTGAQSGFQGVWHLQETGNNGALDATGNHYNGLASDTAPAQVAGSIGMARQFNGVSNYIDLVGTATSKLNFTDTATYSISAWVRVDRFNNQSNVIVSKQLYQYSLQLRNDNYWEFHNYTNSMGFESTSSAATPGIWTYVVGVRSGKNQYLFVNGYLTDMLTADTVSGAVGTMPRITANDVFIGRLPAINNQGQIWRHFTGVIDEVRISNVAYSVDWIKLCYMNQRSDDKLISF
jgi:hypothetical protein